MTLYIGLMSGTSMDGIDAAIVDINTHALIHGITKPYSQNLKHKLQRLINEPLLSLADISQVHTEIGKEFAKTVNELLLQAKLTKEAIQAIGSHGQTIAHDVKAQTPYTIQLGCAHTIAEHTQIPVVADFRTRDLVLGGQGAPFAPLYHQHLFANLTNQELAVVNIGGIANISLISKTKPTEGWDVGPGNCLLDAWIAKHQNKTFDYNGDWSRTGKIDDAILYRLQQDPFFTAPKPKSIGKEYFSLSMLENLLPKQYNPADIQATLTTLTAYGISLAINQCPNPVSRLLLCGGGAHNSALREILSQYLPECTIESTEVLGVSPDFLEAQLFAWLASQTMQSIPVDLTTITGSSKRALLGAIYPVNR
jgi:anhydro-N-acetylmuramic acid kinase